MVPPRAGGTHIIPESKSRAVVGEVPDGSDAFVISGGHPADGFPPVESRNRAPAAAAGQTRPAGRPVQLPDPRHGAGVPGPRRQGTLVLLRPVPAVLLRHVDGPLAERLAAGRVR